MKNALILAGALALTSLPAAAETAAAEASATVVELGQMNRDFAAAINAKDAKAAAALYTEDAILIPPGEAIVRGRAASEEFWAGALEAVGERHQGFCYKGTPILEVRT